MFMLFWCRFLFLGNLSGLGGGPFHVKGGFIFPSRCCDGIFVGHRDRCIDDRLGDQRHIFSSCDEFACFKTEVLLIYEWSSGEPYEWNVNFIVLHPKFHVEKICQERFLVGIPSDQPTTAIYACWGPTLLHVKQNIQPACFWKIDQFITIHRIQNKLNLRDAPYLAFFMTFDHDQTPVLCNLEVIK